MLKKLLVPLDRSPLAAQAVDEAVALARAAHAAIDLVLVHQPETMSGFGDTPWNAAQADDEYKYLDGLVEELDRTACVPITRAVIQGEVVEMICQRARAVNADLVVMTSHGRTGLSRSWLGSVANGILRHSTVPVLLLRPVNGGADAKAAHPLFKHILVPLDGSEFATDILACAVDMARCADGRISLLRVVEPVPLMPFGAGPGMGLSYAPFAPDTVSTELLVSDVQQQLANVAQRLREQEDIEVDAHVVIGMVVAQTILDFAESHDVHLIAMSTHGRGVSRLILGSVADRLLRAGALPLLLHRPARASAVLGAASTPGAGQKTPSLAPA